MTSSANETAEMLSLPVFAVEHVFADTRRPSSGPACPAESITAANAPSRNSPSCPECANVMSAVPSRKTENPNGASDPLAPDTAVGA